MMASREPSARSASAPPTGGRSAGGEGVPGTEEHQANPTKVLDLLAALPPSAFAFLNSKNAPENLSILYVLYWNTRWRSPEVGHDDLLSQVNAVVRHISYRPLLDAEFKKLLDQLCDWRLVGKHVAVAPSPREWRINWHQYWLKEDAYQVILSLEELHARRKKRPVWTKGRDHIRTLADSLDRIESKLQKASVIGEEDSAAARDLRREAYSDLLLLHGRDFSDFKGFLSDINKDLLELGRTPSVDFVRVQGLIDRLESFVENTLRLFKLRGEEVLRTVQRLSNDHLTALAEGLTVERAAYDKSAPRVPASDDTHPSPVVPLRDLRRYFAWDGGLDVQSRRIQASASLTVQRLREYYEALTQRGRVREMLDLRIHELTNPAAVHDEEAVVAWLTNLFPLIRGQFAPGIGTPERRGTPQLPGRRYPYHRAQITETELDMPHDTPGTVLAKLLEAASRLNDFVETRILTGRDSASFKDARIQDIHDFRNLLNAIKHEPSIVGTPLAKHLSFTVRDPRGSPLDPIDVARWLDASDLARYEGPDLIVNRKTQQPHPAPPGSAMSDGAARPRRPVTGATTR